MDEQPKPSAGRKRKATRRASRGTHKRRGSRASAFPFPSLSSSGESGEMGVSEAESEGYEEEFETDEEEYEWRRLYSLGIRGC